MVLVLANFFFSGVATATFAGDLLFETLGATTATSAATTCSSFAAEALTFGTFGALALTTFLAGFLEIGFLTN